MDLGEMRETYGLGELLESQVDADPIVQFGKWLAQATEAGLAEPNAMVIATGRRGRPSVGADCAAEGSGRARLRLLHQPAVPQG
ncbi:hypothetical protein [Kribbella qitaiheensis]|uniref:hypothetical protein n=1 Tax=Kribbella qitaiheensis TaxID=1544730 RepID=UPI001FEC73CE|nr:hypothetical protein [Kribbella qitaiheensis]